MKRMLSRKKVVDRTSFTLHIHHFHMLYLLFLLDCKGSMFLQIFLQISETLHCKDFPSIEDDQISEAFLKEAWISFARESTCSFSLHWGQCLGSIVDDEDR